MKARPRRRGALVDALQDGAADAVTFTAAPQVQALAAAAGDQGVLGPVLDGFNNGGVIAACIGPVCAGAAVSEGISEPISARALAPRFAGACGRDGVGVASGRPRRHGRAGLRFRPVSDDRQRPVHRRARQNGAPCERLCVRPGAGST